MYAETIQMKISYLLNSVIIPIKKISISHFGSSLLIIVQFWVSPINFYNCYQYVIMVLMYQFLINHNNIFVAISIAQIHSQTFFFGSNLRGSGTEIISRTFWSFDCDTQFAISSFVGIFQEVVHHNQYLIHHAFCPSLYSSKISQACRDTENSFLDDNSISSQKNQVQRNQ